MTEAHLEMVFKAFADQTRLRILNLLRGGELCVGDIVTVIKAPQPTISRHLAYLRRAGLVAVDHEGTWCYYSLAETTSEFQKRLIECLGCCLTEAPQLKRDSRTLDVLRRKGGCCSRQAFHADGGATPLAAPSTSTQ